MYLTFPRRLIEFRSTTSTHYTITNRLISTLKTQMSLAIQRSMSGEVQPTVSPNIVKSRTAAIRTEFTIFRTTGVRRRCLQLAYSYLLPVPPASVEAEPPERAFSAAGLLCAKICSRMSDKSLDELCFLRSFYNIIFL